MENIYKIRVRTNPDPRGLYPSERRYSASTVLGLGVVHLALAATALLLASLSATVYQNQYNTHLIAEMKSSYDGVNEEVIVNASTSNSPQEEPDEEKEELFVQEETMQSNRRAENFTRMLRKREVIEEMMPKEFNPCTNLSIAPSLMTIGALAAGLTGLLAWKRWYIDHNIRWFFGMSVISTITSSISLIITSITIVLVNGHGGDSFFNIVDSKSSEPAIPNKELVLAYNILIASFLELMWSVLSTKIGWIGMRANYPEDIINRSRGKVEVNTIHKGNRKGKIIPPDIISHFPVSGKIAKYFPKKESGNLPKAESNSEYMDRVKKFLSSNPDSAK